MKTELMQHVCPVCSEAVASRGLRNHIRHKHGQDPSEVLAAPTGTGIAVQVVEDGPPATSAPSPTSPPEKPPEVPPEKSPEKPPAKPPKSSGRKKHPWKDQQPLEHERDSDTCVGANVRYYDERGTGPYPARVVAMCDPQVVDLIVTFDVGHERLKRSVPRERHGRSGEWEPLPV